MKGERPMWEFIQSDGFWIVLVLCQVKIIG
jgi:hypothetical protein